MVPFENADFLNWMQPLLFVNWVYLRWRIHIFSNYSIGLLTWYLKVASLGNSTAGNTVLKKRYVKSGYLHPYCAAGLRWSHYYFEGTSAVVPPSPHTPLHPILISSTSADTLTRTASALPGTVPPEAGGTEGSVFTLGCMYTNANMGGIMLTHPGVGAHSPSPGGGEHPLGKQCAWRILVWSQFLKTGINTQWTEPLAYRSKQTDIGWHPWIKHTRHNLSHINFSRVGGSIRKFGWKACPN